MNKTMGKRKAIFLGNGFTRALVKNVPTWGQLIGCFNSSDAVQQTIALLDRDVPVLMTNFPTILNRLTGMFSEDRSEFIASFDEYDLLIIDDLGVERSTEYAMEQMFFVIDSRYRSRRPMIITTNLKLAELKNPPDLAHARIYDRILERCAPILFDGKNFREENVGATRQTAKDIVNSKHD